MLLFKFSFLFDIYTRRDNLISYNVNSSSENFFSYSPINGFIEYTIKRERNAFLQQEKESYKWIIL